MPLWFDSWLPKYWRILNIPADMVSPKHGRQQFTVALAIRDPNNAKEIS
jgi:hypothetical protein